MPLLQKLVASAKCDDPVKKVTVAEQQEGFKVSVAMLREIVPSRDRLMTLCDLLDLTLVDLRCPQPMRRCVPRSLVSKPILALGDQALSVAALGCAALCLLAVTHMPLPFVLHALATRMSRPFSFGYQATHTDQGVPFAAGSALIACLAARNQP